MLKKVIFIALVIACLTPWGSPPIALAMGIILALTVGTPFPELSGKPTKYLLQASVVLLGFGMNLSAVLKAGRDGILFTIATIFGTLLLGWLLGRFLSINEKTSALVSSGTAICGGSAIAAVGPSIKADTEQMSVALATIFVLNSVALFVFPIIGHLVGLSQTQFGVWCAIAIHDTSSVVGAAGTYGTEALAIATTVKLARALWIAPIALLFAYLYRDRSSDAKLKLKVPWFIFLFLLATVIRTYMPATVPPSIFDSLVNLAKAGMTLTLFLIGASLSRKTLKAVGVRPLVQGIILWIVISVVGLWSVMSLLG